MARDVHVEVEGLREFRRDLRKLDAAVDAELRGEIREAAMRVLGEARARAPRLTGALAQSLKVSVTQRGAAIFSRLPYAPVVHWGGTIQPRGTAISFPRTEFITQAVERHADQLVEDIGDGIETAAKRVGWR